MDPASEPRDAELLPCLPEDELVGIEGVLPLEPLEPTLGMPPLEPELPDDDELALGLELPDEPEDDDEEDALGMLGAPELLDCCCCDWQLASNTVMAAACARTRACLRNFDTLMMQILFRAAGLDMLFSPGLQVNTGNSTSMRLFTDETDRAPIIIRKYLNAD